MTVKLFTEEFLNKLQEKIFDISLLDEYLKTMSFNNAILKLAEYHNIEPEYCDAMYKGTPLTTEKLAELLEEYA